VVGGVLGFGVHANGAAALGGLFLGQVQLSQV
jgi:hypothetical protein